MPDKTEYEKLLLACALMGGPDVARELLALVQPPMLADVRLARAWSALRRVLATATGPVDLIDALAAELGGEADEAPSLVELHGLTAMVLTAANFAYYAGQVRRAYARRWLAARTPETIERNPHADEAELLAGLEHGARHVRELLAGPGGAAPVVVSAAEYADAPQPAPVLWRDDPAAPDSTDVDAVLSVGECAILASAGGLGKSTLVLELASAAVAAADFDRPSMAACGLAVAAGPVVVVSYEDAPARIAHRLTWCNAGNVPGAGVVAGSAAWFDGARGVLSLVVDPEPESSDRLLTCVKANYGRTGWGARLTERLGPGGAFRGLELGASMGRDDIEAAKRPAAKPGKAAANGAGRVDPTERAALDAL